jgi:AcrR family transcriptional regulator
VGDAAVVPTPIESRRPGRPRDARADRAILEATLDLVGEIGLAGLTVDAVAARAGVSKATIYRRWASKEALVLNAWQECVARTPAPDTGSLRGDLEALIGSLHDGIGSGTMLRVFPQMVAAARTNEELSEEYRRFVAERRRPMREVLRRARSRGEIAEDVDLDVVHDLLVGPLVYRVLISGARIDRRTIETVVDMVLRAAARPADG